MSKFKFVWNYLSSTLVDFKAALVGYRTYKAFLYQTGTDVPVATVVENSLGLTVIYEIDGDGYYYALVNKNLFKTPTLGMEGQPVEVTITPSSSTGVLGNIHMSAYPVFYYVVAIESQRDSVSENNILGDAFSTVLEIKVYNK